MSEANLERALLAAQQEIKSIGKDAHAPAQAGGYAYTSTEHMVRDCRAALHKHGLTVRRTGWKAGEIFGKSGFLVHSTIVLAHAESGEKDATEVAYPAYVQISDRTGKPTMGPDKVCSAALTTTLNYYLRDLLLVPRFDEEVDSIPPQTVTQPVRQAARQSPPAAAVPPQPQPVAQATVTQQQAPQQPQGDAGLQWYRGTIETVDEYHGENDRGPWCRYDVKLSEPGWKLSTFDANLAGQASSTAGTGQLVNLAYTVKINGKYKNLTLQQVQLDAGDTPANVDPASTPEAVAQELDKAEAPF